MSVNALILLMGVMTALWLVSLRLRDASIVDPFWGMGFILTLGYVWGTTSEARGDVRSEMLMALTSIWGSRLSIHLWLRNRGHGEDRRYQAMRATHGARFWWVSLFTVFWLQGLILWFVAGPIQVVMTSPSSARSPLGWLDTIGLIVWAVGFLFEAIGDWQLTRFQADPANQGRVLDQGLWYLTRHPNYFGESSLWWGVYLIACAGGAAWTVLSPLLMTVLLLKVSGVTLLEQTIRDRRPEYSAYQQRTSAFLPWWPRQTTKLKGGQE